MKKEKAGGYEQKYPGRLPRRCRDTAPSPEPVPLDPFVRAGRAVVAWRRGPPSSPFISLALALSREAAHRTRNPSSPCPSNRRRHGAPRAELSGAAASPRPPLRLRQAALPGTPSSSRHHQITASTPAAVHCRFPPSPAIPVVTEHTSVSGVSTRTRPTLFPPQCRRGSSTRSISVARCRATVRHCRPCHLRRPLGSSATVLG